MSYTPTIQVLMPVFNAENFIEEAIESILEQSFTDWQLLILDDGSTDNSLAIIKELARKDSRVLWKSRANLGLVETLNELVDWSTAPFLARMDADDISRVDRLQKQYDFLKSQPDVSLVGCWVKLFGSKVDTWHYRESHEELVVLSLFGRCCLLHPTFLAKREVFEQYPFHERHRHVEDLDFLSRIICDGRYRLGAVREILFDYRQHPDSIIYQNESVRQEKYLALLQKHLSALGGDLKPEYLTAYAKFVGLLSVNSDELVKIGTSVKVVMEATKVKYPDNTYEFAFKWLDFCRKNVDSISQSVQLYKNVFPNLPYCLLSERP